MNLCSFFPLFESVIYRFSDVFYFYLMIWWLVLVHNSAQIYPPLGVVSSHSCPKVWVFKHPRDNELKCFRYDSRIILFKFSVLAWQRMMEKRFLVWARWERFSDMFYDSWWEEKYVALRNASSGKLETNFFFKLRILKVNTKKMTRIARLWRRQEWQWWHHTPYLCKKKLTRWPRSRANFWLECNFFIFFTRILLIRANFYENSRHMAFSCSHPLIICSHSRAIKFYTILL